MAFQESSLENLRELISKKQAIVTVIGLGKMGLPLASIISHTGFSVIGVDISPFVVETVNRGESHVQNEPFVDEFVKEGVSRGTLRATTNIAEALKKADIVIVLIPVLLKDDMTADIPALERVYRPIAKGLRKGMLIIQESTVPPRTTREVLKQILEEESGLVEGRDFALVHAPERTYSGRVVADIMERYPKILGGVSPVGGELASAFYKTFAGKGVIALSNADAAEAVKVFEGVYRDVNIALANELAKIAELLKVNVLEVIDACNTQPFSHIHRPGIGVGGHCIPVYPHFVIQTGEQAGYEPVLIKDGRKINLSMPYHAVDSVSKAIEQYGLPSWKEQRVLVLGLAYRGNVKEHRHSPTLSLVPELLLKNPKDLLVVDPMYSAEEIRRVLDVKGSSTIPVDFQASLIFIATDHKEFKEWATNLQSVEQSLQDRLLIYDGRYLFPRPQATNLIILQPGQVPSDFIPPQAQ